MSISDPFIKRPIMTSLVMISILVFGVIAYKALPVSDLPNVDYPTIQVKVSYPGANPSTMSSTCATPLEQEFMTIEGLEIISSQSTTGSTVIVMQFDLNRPIDSAAIDVQAAINRAQPKLPQNLPYNPTYEKVNPAAAPILYLALTSPTMTLAELYDYGNTFFGQRISMINGVSQVQTYGSPFAARIQINPEEITAIGIGLDQVTAAIKEANVDLPTGTLFGDKNEYTIDVDGQLLQGKKYEDITIKNEDGSIVKIAQVGRAFDSLQKDKFSIEYATTKDKVPSVILAIRKQVGENTVRVIDDINEILPGLMKQAPPSLKMHNFYDKAKFIQAGVDDVQLTLFIAFILVIFIIYFTLGKITNTIIPVLVLPLSMLGTFCVMYFFNYSIDILSLLALTLSIGFLVDDAIVVLENNVRHVQEGMTPMDATFKGSTEIGFTIVSTSLCLAAVFLPMLLLGGIVGRIFREFAMVICIAIVFSTILALTFTPLLCSRFIPKKVDGEKPSFAEKFANWITKKLLTVYERSLKTALNNGKKVLLIGLASIIGSAFVFVAIPKDFLPEDDESFLTGFIHSDDGTSPFQMKRYQDEAVAKVLQDPAVDSLMAVTALQQDNEGLLFVNLKSFSERGPIDKVIARLMETLYPFAGFNSFLATIPLINLQSGTGLQKGLYQYSLTSIHQEDINKYTDQIIQ
nr:efflux RND transporter permease subunit [Chlamydiales bacterium]